MRVLLAFEHLGPIGGAERSIIEEAEELSRAGYEFVVAYRVGDSFLPRWQAIGAELIPVPLSVSWRRPIRSLAGTVRSVRLLRGIRVDLVHCNFLYTLPLCLTVARRLGVPVVASVREPVAGGVRGAAYGRLLHRVACIGFMSAHQRHAYERRGFVTPGAPVIANGIDVAWFRPPTDSERAEARLRCGLSVDQLAVVYLGRIDPVKGIETLLAAMSPLPDPRIVVLVAGGVTPSRHHERYASRLAASAPPGVLFIGRDDDPRRLLWAADVVVVPSLWEEPLARSALEAMACGVPVVASRTGGLPEILPRALSELLFRPGDPADLLEALRRALPELGGPRRWNASVRDVVVGQFSLGATTEALDGLFRRAIDGQRASRASLTNRGGRWSGSEGGG